LDVAFNTETFVFVISAICNVYEVTEELVHSKNAGLFQPKFGSNMDKPKCWVKNVIDKYTVESESWVTNFKLHF